MLAIRQQRVEQMSILIADFAVILDGGDLLVEKTSNRQNSTENKGFVDEYICFCKRIERYIHIHSKLLFEVWASQEEKQVLQNIKAIVINERINFIKNNDDSDIQIQSRFAKFNNEIGKQIKKLSTLLKHDVENIHK